ncbi:hypothetical protein BGZ80_005758 [Entomortierella chlamydospora]|uniref:RRM domain-containing protein n=1 Tax=Entomortierella chlamydospora TaxID=101097 RepID=A0A9P6N0M2_9FUNG|nr:hypothetical protein BGZ80_005758 [Entomortierella chlamydospora]
MNNLQAGGLIDIGNSDINFESNCGSRSELPSIPSLDPASSAESRHFSPELMDLDNGPVFFRRAALLTPGITIKGEGGPVTIEIENLHPSTTAEDVMVACSRYGEIQTCMCSSGYAQVTYFKKIAGLAAISMLDGKYSDNGKAHGMIAYENTVTFEWRLLNFTTSKTPRSNIASDHEGNSRNPLPASKRCKLNC